MAPLYQVREVREWPGKARQRYQRKPAPFKRAWAEVEHNLARELRHLNAADVVLEGFFDARHIKRDGTLYADARPREPGVVLTFRNRSTGHTYQFAADRYGYWQDNLDAIARSLEALRSVDRYGVVAGQQYEGFRKLPPAGKTTETKTTEWAADVLARHTNYAAGLTLNDSEYARLAARAARAKAHPDAGGSDEAFVEVQAAIQRLEAHHGVTL